VYGVDLHGCSETICRICMLSWLRQLKRGQATVTQLDQPYMEIITGWGKNSKVLGVSKVSWARTRVVCRATHNIHSFGHAQWWSPEGAGLGMLGHDRGRYAPV